MGYLINEMIRTSCILSEMLLFSVWLMTRRVLFESKAQAVPIKRVPIGILYQESWDDIKYFQAVFTEGLKRLEHGTHSQYNLDPQMLRFDQGNASDNFVMTKAVCSLLPAHPVFLYSTVGTDDAIESVTRSLRMPYVTSGPPSLRDSAEENRLGYTLEIRPRYEGAIAEVIAFYDWQTVTYLYDSEQALWQVERINSILQSINLNHTIDARFVRFSSDNENYALLRWLDRMYGFHERKFVLASSTSNNLQKIINQITVLGMHRVGYDYIICTLAMDELELSLFVHGGANVMGLKFLNSRFLNRLSSTKSGLSSLSTLSRLLNNRLYNGKQLTLDAALASDSALIVVQALTSLIKTDEEIFQKISQGVEGRSSTMESRHRACDRQQPWIYGPTVMKHLKEVQTIGLTGSVSFDDYGQRKDYLLGIMRISLDKPITRIGAWSSNGTVKFYVPKLNTIVYQNRNGTRIVSTILTAPYLMMRKRSDDGSPLRGNDRFEGYCADLAQLIAAEIGFNYSLQLTKDGKFGVMTRDGTWNGIMGELTRREVDLAVAPLTISSNRERVVDFSKPFMNLGVSIMIKKPDKIKPGILSFMDPLSSLIWLCIALAYLSVSAVLYLITRISSVHWGLDPHQSSPRAMAAVMMVSSEAEFTLLNSLWFSLAGFMRQACSLSPRTLPGRMAGSSWWFFTLIIISSYTANLAAFLTIERMRTPIDGADDLAKQSYIKYGTLESGSTMDFFQMTRVSVYEKMWGSMRFWGPQVFVNTTLEGVKKVQREKGRYAFLLESTMNDYHNQREPCNTLRVGDLLDFKGYGIATPIGSNLREPLGMAVLLFHESGVLQKLHKKWWFDKGGCPHDGEGKGSSRNALTLSNVAGIFYILIIGLGASVFVTLTGLAFKIRVQTFRNKIQDHYERGNLITRCPVHEMSSVDSQCSTTDQSSSTKCSHSDNKAHIISTSTVNVTRSNPITLI